MNDITMGLVVVAFFFVCVGYVAWCGRIIGPDPVERGTESVSSDTMSEGKL